MYIIYVMLSIIMNYLACLFNKDELNFGVFV